MVLVLTTVPDDASAETIARTLVDEQLAACVNLLAPMTSIYRWKGAVERDTERQLVMKTTRALVPALERRLKELHSVRIAGVHRAARSPIAAAMPTWSGSRDRGRGPD